MRPTDIASVQNGDTVLKELVKLQRPNDWVQPVFINSACDAPQWVAVLFAGNCGAVALTPNGPTKMQGNFLLRTADYWTTKGCATAIVDTPSKPNDGTHREGGMSDAFRLGPQHAQDMQAVVANLRSRFPAARIAFVGTSRGTVSVGGVLCHDPELADAYVLTSPITVKREGQPGLSGTNWKACVGPVLVVSNKMALLPVAILRGPSACQNK